MGAVKVLLLNQTDRCYLTQQGDWSDDANEARNFAFTEQARDVAKGMKLRKFQIVFYFPEIKYQIVVADSEKPPLKLNKD